MIMPIVLAKPERDFLASDGILKSGVDLPHKLVDYAYECVRVHECISS